MRYVVVGGIKLRRVVPGDTILPEDYNNLVDAFSIFINSSKLIRDRIKELESPTAMQR